MKTIKGDIMELVNLSVKVAPEVRQRLKLYCVLNNISMADAITSSIGKLKVVIPEIPEVNKPAKRQKTKTSKTVKRKDENPDADEEVIKVEILKHKEAGLSLQKIADALNDSDIPTLRGGAEWAKGTIDGLLRKWGEK
jgi:hypothetical protein